METNEVVLAPLASLYKNEMYLKDWNLISAHRVLGAETVIVKIRYRKQANRCMVAQEENGYLRVSLLEPLESIAPGKPPPFMMRTACCWAVALFFEVELQHLFHVFSCIAEARYLMLSAKLAFIVQPIVEQIRSRHDYFQRLQGNVFMAFSFVIGVNLL